MAYSKDRILYPMKRVDFDPDGDRNIQNRGKSEFERISGRWRYLGSASVMRLNLSIAGQAPGGQEVLFDYGLEGWAVTQSLRYRLGESDWWVGALFDYLQMTTASTIEQIPGLDPIELDSSLGSLGTAVRYDSRNNTFTPDRGLFADVEVRRRAEWVGSDFEYWAAKPRKYAAKRTILTSQRCPHLLWLVRYRC